MAAKPEEAKCTNCGSGNIVNDSCGAEDMLVCEECGCVVSSDSMVYASDNNWFSGMTNKTTPDIDSTTKVEAGIRPLNDVKKKARVIKLVMSICRELKMREQDRRICIGFVDQVKLEEEIPVWVSERILAAGIVFFHTTDHSLASLRKLQNATNIKVKKLRISMKELCEIPIFKRMQPLPTLSMKEAFVNEVDKIETIDMTMDERKLCISMCCSIWEILQINKLKRNINNYKPACLIAVILLVLENIKKMTSRKELYASIVGREDSVHHIFKKFDLKVRKELYELSKDIPSLELVRGKRKGTIGFTQVTISRYLPTIIQNKSYIFAKHKLCVHKKSVEAEKDEAEKDEVILMPPHIVASQSTSSVCNWVDEDDDGSLSDLDDDIDQYLATSKEVYWACLSCDGHVTVYRSKRRKKVWKRNNKDETDHEINTKLHQLQML
jgi:hypothetical protein